MVADETAILWQVEAVRRSQELREFMHFAHATEGVEHLLQLARTFPQGDTEHGSDTLPRTEAIVVDAARHAEFGATLVDGAAMARREVWTAHTGRLLERETVRAIESQGNATQAGALTAIREQRQAFMGHGRTGYARRGLLRRHQTDRASREKCATFLRACRP